MAAGPQPPDSPGTADRPSEATVPPPAQLPHHRIRRTRISGVWAAVACFAVILLLLLIFILQNGHTVEISYLGADGHLPLGVALLLAAVFGVLLVALPGTARILQLRLIARRHRRADARHLTAPPVQPQPPAPAGPPAGNSTPSP